MQHIADLMAGADIRYAMPGEAHPMTGRWMPDLPLERESGSTRVAELMHAARPILLDLAGRIELVTAAPRVGAIASQSSVRRPARARRTQF